MPKTAPAERMAMISAWADGIGQGNGLIVLGGEDRPRRIDGRRPPLRGLLLAGALAVLSQSLGASTPPTTSRKEGEGAGAHPV